LQGHQRSNRHRLIQSPQNASKQALHNSHQAEAIT
jgi:hypothetical protein